MTEPITLYNLHPSPNNVKVRVGLNYKQIRYERVDIDLGSGREAVVEATGQPLCPAIVHGRVALFDSSAILRYLDANFRDTPPLFSSDRQEMREIERWEMAGRTHIGEPLRLAANQLFSDAPDDSEVQRAGALLNERTAELEEHLKGRQWLAGDRLTAADIVVGVPVFYGMIPDELASKYPPAAYLRENYQLGAGRDRIREWVRRVMVHADW